MTIEEQIELLRNLEADGQHERDASEIMTTLRDCQRLVTEKDRDIRAHLFHFMKQRLTGQQLPTAAQLDAVAGLRLTTGQWLEHCGRTMQFISSNSQSLLAMDKSGKEISIPKTQWKNIKTSI